MTDKGQSSATTENGNAVVQRHSEHTQIGNVQPGLNQAPPAIDPTYPPSAVKAYRPGSNILAEKLPGLCIGIQDSNRPIRSTYWPNFTFLDRQISVTQKLLIPHQYYSRTVGEQLATEDVKIAYFILAIYQIFKNQTQQGKGSPQITEAIEYLEANFDLKDILIDGSVKHYFECLSPSHPEDKIYNCVFPILPPTPSDYNPNNFSWDDIHLARFPNLPLLFRARHRLLTGVEGNAANQARVYTHGGAYNLTTENVNCNGQPHGAGPRYTQYLRVQPGFCNENYLSLHPERYAQKASTVTPRRPTALDGPMTWLDFLGFWEDTDPEWFSELLTQLFRRNEYFDGNEPLDKLLLQDYGVTKIELGVADDKSDNIDAYLEAQKPEVTAMDESQASSSSQGAKTRKAKKRKATTDDADWNPYITHDAQGMPHISSDGFDDIPLDPTQIPFIADILTAERPCKPMLIAFAREQTCSEMHLRQAIVTQWQLPPPIFLNPTLRFYPTYDGPFWNLPHRTQTTELNVHNNLYQTLTSTFIREKTARSKI